jgi:hypothetical protein
MSIKKRTLPPHTSGQSKICSPRTGLMRFLVPKYQGLSRSLVLSMPKSQKDQVFSIYLRRALVSEQWLYLKLQLKIWKKSFTTQSSIAALNYSKNHKTSLRWSNKHRGLATNYRKVLSQKLPIFKFISQRECSLGSSLSWFSIKIMTNSWT